MHVTRHVRVLRLLSLTGGYPASQRQRLSCGVGLAHVTPSAIETREAERQRLELLVAAPTECAALANGGALGLVQTSRGRREGLDLFAQRIRHVDRIAAEQALHQVFAAVD